MPDVFINKKLFYTSVELMKAEGIDYEAMVKAEKQNAIGK